MTIHITTERMTSDQTKHHAQRVNQAAGVWAVSWLPGRRLDYNQATTAMALAEIVSVKTSAGGLSCDDPVWPLIDNRAGELGMSGPAAVTRLGV